MRLIDADALIKNICTEQCGKRREDCDARCEYVTSIDNAPTIDSVPIKPLARWLAGHVNRVGWVKPSRIIANPDKTYFELATDEWTEFLRDVPEYKNAEVES